MSTDEDAPGLDLDGDDAAAAAGAAADALAGASPAATAIDDDALYEAPTAEVFNEFLDIRPAPAAQVSFASSPSLPRSAVSGSLSR